MSQESNNILNSVLIDMARSFLQYVSESSPWVGVDAAAIEEQFSVLAVRQRQDVSDIVALLTDREHPVDLGTYPTEYTDQQFLALGAVFQNLRLSQQKVCASIAEGLNQLKSTDDASASELLETIDIRQKELAKSLLDLEQDLCKVSSNV